MNNTLAHDSTTDVGNQLTISDKEQERLQSLLAEKERVLEVFAYDDTTHFMIFCSDRERTNETN